jgi:hypothetical protein
MSWSILAYLPTVLVASAPPLFAIEEGFCCARMTAHGTNKMLRIAAIGSLLFMGASGIRDHYTREKFDHPLQKFGEFLPRQRKRK